MKPKLKKKILDAEAKLAILAIARESGNVDFTCFSAGISRSTFYKIRQAFYRHGHEGLKPKARRKPKMPNAFSEETIQKVLETTKIFPSYSYLRIAERLCSEGLKISGSGVYKIWRRHGLTKRQHRFAQAT